MVQRPVFVMSPRDAGMKIVIMAPGLISSNFARTGCTVDVNHTEEGLDLQIRFLRAIIRVPRQLGQIILPWRGPADPLVRVTQATLETTFNVFLSGLRPGAVQRRGHGLVRQKADEVIFAVRFSSTEKLTLPFPVSSRFSSFHYRLP